MYMFIFTATSLCNGCNALGGTSDSNSSYQISWHSINKTKSVSKQAIFILFPGFPQSPFTKPLDTAKPRKECERQSSPKKRHFLMKK